MDVRSALDACADWKLVRQRLEVLDQLGLGYLTLGEATPTPLRRRGPAAQTGQRDGPGAGGHGIRL